jgi:outer membrane protein assembly factor BamB
MRFRTLFLTFALLLHCSFIWAGNWAQWRGPNFDGSTTEKNLPTEFSTNQNVQWSVAVPGTSASTPIVWDDHIFLSSGVETDGSLRAIALDSKTGKLLWNNEVGIGSKLDDKSNLASPSPVTDGKVAIFYYGNGDLAAFDFSGKALWSRSIQKDYGQFAYQWTYGSSPLLFDGKLYVQVLQRDEPVHNRGRTDKPIESYLLALDPQTGKELWKHVRPSDARMESHEAYSTPIPFESNGRTELLITGGDCITGHNPKTGEELWRWGTWNPTRITHWRLVPSPVAGNSIILACAPKAAPISAFKAGAKGTLEESAIAWKSVEREVSSDVSTPLFYKGRFYVVNGERRTIARVDPATGKPDWIGDLQSRIKIESSPTAADDKIYFQNFHGEVFVVAAGDQFKLLQTAAMGDDGDENLRSSIAIANGALFIRSAHKLYCVGQQN